MGVAGAFGFAVIRATGGRVGAVGAIPQEERRKTKPMMRVRRFFMYGVLRAERSEDMFFVRTQSKRMFA